MIKPVQCDNQCCERGMNQDWQPDTINDRSINQTKNSGRMTHCLQSKNHIDIQHPKVSIGLARLDLKDSFKSHPPQDARTPCCGRTIEFNGKNCRRGIGRHIVK